MDADIIRNRMTDVLDIMECVDSVVVQVSGIMCTQCLDLSPYAVNILSIVSQ